MSEIILDISANTHKNNINYIKKMIDAIVDIDTKKHTIIFKHQLFREAGKNIPLKQDTFDYAYCYAASKGYETTASVFDKFSLDFLLQYQIPFIKIANKRELDWIVGEISRKIPVYISGDNETVMSWCFDIYSTSVITNNEALCCISKYPAELQEYERTFNMVYLKHAISDHTKGLELCKKYKPVIWEKHLKLEDSTGLDAGDWAATPKALGAIL